MSSSRITITRIVYTEVVFVIIAVISLWWPLNETNPNDIAIRNIFQDEVDTVIPTPCQPDLGCHIGAYWSTVSLLVVVAKIASNVD